MAAQDDTAGRYKQSEGIAGERKVPAGQCKNCGNGRGQHHSMLVLSFCAFTLTLTAPAGAHAVPDVFTTGQRLVDQFDPSITPKMLYSADGTFIDRLPAGSWATNSERYRHIRSIDAENGRWYIRAVYDGARDKHFCFPDTQRPNDETFYEQAVHQLRALPRARLQSDSAADLLVDIWRAKWPCGGVK